MDEQRFDQLARALGQRISRRHAALLASGAMGLLLGRPVQAGPTLGKRRCGGRRCNKRGKPQRRVCYKKKCRFIPVAGKWCDSKGLPCRNGAICVATGVSGSEVCVCPAGTTACGAFPDTECVNLRTDPFHCGSCLNRCLAGQTTCCAVGPLAPGECVDTSTDPQHCGGCGRSCGAGERCLGGECASQCRAGLTLCGDTCADTTSDPAHCGACGRDCGSGEVCVSSQCQPPCVLYGQACSGPGQCCNAVPCSGGLCRFN
jgi:hypothetical protein